MTDVLLISNSLENINVAWRHFRYSEYNTSATTNIEAALDNLRSSKPAQIIVYYCGEEVENFYTVYSALRNDPKIAKIPLLVLSDVGWQKALTGYVKLYNTCVLGISVNDQKLKETVKYGARDGFEKPEISPNRPIPKRPTGNSRLKDRIGR